MSEEYRAIERQVGTDSEYVYWPTAREPQQIPLQYKRINGRADSNACGPGMLSDMPYEWRCAAGGEHSLPRWKLEDLTERILEWIDPHVYASYPNVIELSERLQRLLGAPAALGQLEVGED